MPPNLVHPGKLYLQGQSGHTNTLLPRRVDALEPERHLARPIAFA